MDNKLPDAMETMFLALSPEAQVTALKLLTIFSTLKIPPTRDTMMALEFLKNLSETIVLKREGFGHVTSIN